jgi:serine O-acetyltransferase
MKNLFYDARQIAKRDPACKSLMEVIFFYPGFHAVTWHRLSHFLYRLKLYFIARFISQAVRFFTGIEIHPGARIGKGLFIDHGMGVVIGETAEIGDNCTIYHGVTLGGTGKEHGKRHPTVGSNVLIGAGAILLGSFNVGDNAMIGAGTVVLRDVEAGSTVTGIHSRVAKRKADSDAPSFNLDQTHITDPIAQELCMLNIRLNSLEKAISQKEGMN